jgi:integrase/recombinase XerC
MVESFLKYIQFQKRYSLKTVKSYETDLTQFQQYLLITFKEDKIENAGYGLIRSWIVSLVEAKLDASSINRKIACLRSFYKFLMQQEVVDKNPMTKIRVLKTKKKLPHFVKEVDMNTLLDDPDFSNDHEGLREKLILEFFYGTGMRLSELINLKDSQVNLRSKTIKVLGKRNKERVIPFAENLVSMVEAYRKVRDRDVQMKDHGFLFVTDTGDQLYPMLVYRSVKKHLKKFSAVEKRSPHVLRHSYATHLLDKGAEINAVKDLLGHSSLAATQVYTHNSMEKLKKVFEQAHPKA